MDGFVNVLKPPGLTSHDVVLEVRRILGENKAGHLGTLDPSARGVLPVALGSYRRLAEYFLDDDKDYVAEFIFGVRTDTGDLDGDVVARKHAGSLSPGQVREHLARLTGSILQVPPMVSAVKVRGKRLYELARKGVTVEPQPRPVTVHRFEMLGWVPGVHPRGVFFLRVGRGTYVRALADSLGESLGCGAAVSFLLRSRVGRFYLKDGHTIASLELAKKEGRLASILADPLEVLSPFARFEVKSEALEKIRNGTPLETGDFEDPGSLTSWMRKEATGNEKRRSLFLGTHFSREDGCRKIVAVLSTAAGSTLACKIKYEKVLI
ncbi:MAG: tRNA pseudouridine(55) synthase TruB [Candidatus Fermentithermobacillus carboniphilus]|uniref:tRNA pseudouridine synthase B n=1 Tax=Candidatus Fermentithermobacillus carboniphilus TaxID=3085328 RepID=A0AAT9LDB3_9FIRM|nr:MAG: tRNA pseudouridine(55) synthase TruB [Candidatus Fermentithermobacillus carboniphilus]